MHKPTTQFYSRPLTSDFVAYLLLTWLIFTHIFYQFWQTIAKNDQKDQQT